MVTSDDMKKIYADIQSGAIKPNEFIEKINKHTQEYISQSAISTASKASSESIAEANKLWSNFINTVQSAGEKYGQTALKALLLTNTMRDLLKSFKDTSAFSSTQVGIDSVAKSYKDLGEVGSLVLKKMGFSDASLKWITALSDSSSYARQMENSLINLSAASGTLNQFLSKTGDNFKNLDQVAMKFDAQNLKVANSMGVLKPEVEKVAISLGEIPGALDAAFSVKGIGRITELQAAMTLAKATGQDYGIVTQNLKKAYEDFNLTGEKAIKFQAQMASASKELGMPLKAVQTAVEGVAEAFRKFGDNTGSAVKLTSQLAPALKEVGVAQRQILEITQSVASSISQMNVASRAFLSARTGGPGGLRGAMQIEAMLMKGDAAGVAKMSEEALRKQFGKVVGVEEATKSQAAAAQFERQKQLLSSGAFGLKLEGPDATKFLDAMSKGKVFDITKAGKKPEDALAETMKLGNQILDKNRDAIIDNTNSTILNNAALQSFQDLAILRNTTGSEGALKSKMEIRAKEDREKAAGLTDKKYLSTKEYSAGVFKDTSRAMFRDFPDVLKSTAAAAIDQYQAEVKSLKARGEYTSEKALSLKSEYASLAGIKQSMFDKAVKEKDNIPLKYFVASQITEAEKTGGVTLAKKQMGTAPSPKSYAAIAMKEREEAEIGLKKAKGKAGKSGEEEPSSTVVIKMECPICHQKHIEKTIHKSEKDKTAKGLTGTTP